MPYKDSGKRRTGKPKGGARDKQRIADLEQRLSITEAMRASAWEAAGFASEGLIAKALNIKKARDLQTPPNAPSDSDSKLGEVAASTEPYEWFYKEVMAEMDSRKAAGHGRVQSSARAVIADFLKQMPPPELGANPTRWQTVFERLFYKLKRERI